MEELIRILHTGGHSCVIANGTVRTFSQRGVADLLHLLKQEPHFLRGASVADKVVGKAAAALMALGRIGELYTDVISTPGRELLEKAGIVTSFGKEVPLIRNRDNTGFCPLETLCLNEESTNRILPLIEKFVQARTPSKT